MLYDCVGDSQCAVFNVFGLVLLLGFEVARGDSEAKGAKYNTMQYLFVIYREIHTCLCIENI